MRKKAGKLRLYRETLGNLSEHRLQRVPGADDSAVATRCCIATGTSMECNTEMEECQVMTVWTCTCPSFTGC